MPQPDRRLAFVPSGPEHVEFELGVDGAVARREVRLDAEAALANGKNRLSVRTVQAFDRRDLGGAEGIGPQRAHAVEVLDVVQLGKTVDLEISLVVRRGCHRHAECRGSQHHRRADGPSGPSP